MIAFLLLLILAPGLAAASGDAASETTLRTEWPDCGGCGIDFDESSISSALRSFSYRWFASHRMIMGANEMNSPFHPARKRVEVSVGESVRIIRELQGFSQNQLSSLTGISQATISAIENGRVNLGVERAKVLAIALDCHPAVLVFPGWEQPIGNAA